MTRFCLRDFVCGRVETSFVRLLNALAEIGKYDISVLLWFWTQMDSKAANRLKMVKAKFESESGLRESGGLKVNK